MIDLRREARGQECQVRIPGICSHDNTTVVLAHLNGGKSLNTKNPDLLGAWCCSACHAAVDGQARSPHRREDLQLWFYEGIHRTQRHLIREGIVRW